MQGVQMVDAKYVSQMGNEMMNEMNLMNESKLFVQLITINTDKLS